jgi:hypothetical protein
MKRPVSFTFITFILLLNACPSSSNPELEMIETQLILEIVQYTANIMHCHMINFRNL